MRSAEIVAPRSGKVTQPFDLPLGKGVSVQAVYEGGVWLLAKPKGVLTHPNKPGDVPRSLLLAAYDSELEAYLWTEIKTGVPRRFFLCHRLDEPTSGLLLGADNEAAAKRIQKTFAEKTIRKCYRAFLFGRVTPERFLWKDNLRKENTAEGPRMVVAARGLTAETKGEVVNVFQCSLGTFSEVMLYPQTGRTHQLRVQSASRGNPIVGDTLYGNFPGNRRLASVDKILSRLFLHAEGLKLNIPELHLDATLPTPASFGLMRRTLQSS
jgi:23S rRNA-/tRNA-specific pseudouridylate synthase